MSAVQRKIKKNRKRTRKIKDMNKTRDLKTGETMYHRKNRKLYILGESMVKKLNGYLLTKKVINKLLV